MYAKPSKDKPMPQSSHWTPGVSCPHGLHRGLLTISLSILFRLLRDHLDSAFRWSCLSMSSLSRDERGWGFAHHLVSSGIVFDFNFKFFLRYLFTDWISYIYIYVARFWHWDIEVSCAKFVSSFVSALWFVFYLPFALTAPGVQMLGCELSPGDYKMTQTDFSTLKLVYLWLKVPKNHPIKVK